MGMISEELRRFYHDNPVLYGTASREDLDQLSRIHELYPDSVRLLSDGEAVELPRFQCVRCGRCCAAVKYVTVSHADVERWVTRGRGDILDRLVIDRLRTPLLARQGKKNIEDAKCQARSLVDRTVPPIRDGPAFELLYLTDLLECAVYVDRKHGACAFLGDDGGRSACTIYDTRPRVCLKFPYYMGKYTDSRLLRDDSFCPVLGGMAKALNNKN
jgi:Fe-S-cluster containining protein